MGKLLYNFRISFKCELNAKAIRLPTPPIQTEYLEIVLILPCSQLEVPTSKRSIEILVPPENNYVNWSVIVVRKAQDIVDLVQEIVKHWCLTWQS